MSGQLELFRLPPPGGDAAAASRHVILNGRIVDYALRRDRRRLVLRIDERGLRVGAPRGLALADIDAFIATHADWVLEKLDAFARRTRPRHVSLHDGARLPVLDHDVVVRVTAGANRGFWRHDEGGHELWLAARPAADLAALARRALQRRALEHFSPRVADAAARLGRPAPRLALSSARMRWGSCSAAGGIRLNWRLIHLPSRLGDYVVAHEAAHLVEMNHGARFWQLVGELCPDWNLRRDELQRLGAELPLL
ncbi:MAG: SprT family zinc-dependent metalloprotease [Pseudomonadota bacterium]